jgi:hypothetical protein
MHSARSSTLRGDSFPVGLMSNTSYVLDSRLFANIHAQKKSILTFGAARL